MDLQSTLETDALQLKNVPRTLVAVARVVQKMMKTLYDAHFVEAENRRPGRNPDSPDSDILTIGWLLEYIAADAISRERVKCCAGKPSQTSYPRWRCLSSIPFQYRFVISSAKVSKSDLKWETDASGTFATYGQCATKGLTTFLGFRGHLITTGTGVPVDFAIASADIDDREVLPLLCEGGRYRVVLGDKGYISGSLRDELLETENTCLLTTLRSNQKQQYPEDFRKRHVRVRRRIETTIGQLT